MTTLIFICVSHDADFMNEWRCVWIMCSLYDTVFPRIHENYRGAELRWGL